MIYIVPEIMPVVIRVEIVDHRDRTPEVYEYSTDDLIELIRKLDRKEKGKKPS